MDGVLMTICLVASAACGAGAWHTPFLPAALEGWKGAHVQVWDRTNLFDYMNGAGELYLAYDFRELAVRDYTRSGRPKVTVEVYRMSSAGDAFGVLSHHRSASSTDPLARGNDRDYGAGLFMTSRGPWFVRVLAEKETPETRKLTAAYAKLVEKAVPKSGALSAVLKLLPKQGMVTRSERFFHKHTVLNFHYYLSDQNILNLGEKTDAVLAQYQLNGDNLRLLVVQYPEAVDATAALTRFERTYLKDKPAPKTYPRIEQIEQGEYVGIAREGRVLRLVFGAKSAEASRKLLAAR